MLTGDNIILMQFNSSKPAKKNTIQEVTGRGNLPQKYFFMLKIFNPTNLHSIKQISY